MHRLVRFIVISLLGLALALALPGAAATPAQAAGVTVGCVGSLYSGPTGIQDAITATSGNVTITVCAGEYRPVLIDGKPGIKLIGKGLPTIRLTENEGFIGALVSVVDSPNFTLQGFILDGNNGFSTTVDDTMMAIRLDNSSATISKNHIVRIRRADTSGDFYDSVIDVYSGAVGTPLTVKIIQNNFIDFQYNAIGVMGNIKPTIQKNRFETSAANSGPVAISVYAIWATGALVSGNTINMDSNYINQFEGSGIQIIETSLAKVTSNKISNVANGILVANACSVIKTGSTSANQITGNQVTNAWETGIELLGSVVVPGDVTTCDPRVTGNTVKSNKITTLTLDGYGIKLDVSGDTSTYKPVVTGNTITSNSLYGYDLSDAVVDEVPLGTGGGNVENVGNTITKNKLLPVPIGG